MAFKKITYEIEQEILTLANKGITKDKIAEMVGFSRMSVFKVLKAYRVPEEKTEVKNKKIRNFNELISPRLFYFCDDIELLAKRLACEIFYQKPEKIIIPNRLVSMVEKEKINKVVNILDRVDLKCPIEYAKA